MEVVDCVICCNILVKPTTLICGHTFCTNCIKISLKNTPVCPICRTPILVDTDNLKENILIK